MTDGNSVRVWHTTTTTTAAIKSQANPPGLTPKQQQQKHVSTKEPTAIRKTFEKHRSTTTMKTARCCTRVGWRGYKDTNKHTSLSLTCINIRAVMQPLPLGPKYSCGDRDKPPALVPCCVNNVSLNCDAYSTPCTMINFYMHIRASFCLPPGVLRLCPGGYQTCPPALHYHGLRS